jgi:NAD+ diphosphatase
MKFIHCPHCGAKLITRNIGDEGEVPFCLSCNIPVFNMPYACVIVIAVNENREIALIRQSYVNAVNHVLIAGYIKSGESAEETAEREVWEEIGIKPDAVRYFRSYTYEKKDMLMLGFTAEVKKADFRLSGEVDGAEWFSFKDAPGRMREGSVARRFTEEYIEYTSGTVLHG